MKVLFIFLFVLLILTHINISLTQDKLTASQAKDFVGEYKYIKGM